MPGANGDAVGVESLANFFVGVSVKFEGQRRCLVAEGLMDNPLYAQAFCVEEVNRLVEAGVPFRDAYKQVGHAVQDGSFHYEGELHHTHEGSIGNLCNAEIKLKFQDRLAAFPFGRVAQAVENLIKNA